MLPPASWAAQPGAVNRGLRLAGVLTRTSSDTSLDNLPRSASAIPSRLVAASSNSYSSFSVDSSRPGSASDTFSSSPWAVGTGGFAAACVLAAPNSDESPQDAVTRLHEAALEGDSATLLQLLNEGLPVNTADKNGVTALHCAVSKGHVNAARVLLNKGAAVNCVNQAGLTPLHMASWSGDSSLVDLLLERGANVQAASEDFGRFRKGYTPLHLAAIQGHAGIARILLDCGAAADADIQGQFRPLHAAASYGHAAVVQLLLEHGADVNAATGISKGLGGHTALHYASGNGHLAVAQLLMERGADLDAVTTVSTGMTFLPLRYAATPLRLAKDSRMIALLKSRKPEVQEAWLPAFKWVS